jgi:hypothetical protein
VPASRRSATAAVGTRLSTVYSVPAATVSEEAGLSPPRLVTSVDPSVAPSISVGFQAAGSARLSSRSS